MKPMPTISLLLAEASTLLVHIRDDNSPQVIYFLHVITLVSYRFPNFEFVVLLQFCFVLFLVMINIDLFFPFFQSRIMFQDFLFVINCK